MMHPLPFLSANPERRMPLLSFRAVLSLVDAIAVVLAQAYQLARIRLASTASPVMRLLCQRDHAHSTLELLKRELSILRSQRESMPPHRRPDYLPEQRLAILQLYATTPCQRDLVRLVRNTIRESGKPRFLITDHGTQFRRGFQSAMGKLDIGHVKGRVRAPYLNGKMERAFRTFRLWWSVILCGATRRRLQRRLDNYRHWYNHHRPHSALHGITPDEAWHGTGLSEPFSFRRRDHVKPRIGIRRLKCRGDPRLPVIQITVQRAA